MTARSITNAMVFPAVDDTDVVCHPAEIAFDGEARSIVSIRCGVSSIMFHTRADAAAWVAYVHEQVDLAIADANTTDAAEVAS